MSWKDRFGRIVDTFFEPSAKDPSAEKPDEAPAVPALSPEQVEACTVDGDAESMAQSLLDEALSQVTSSEEDTIFKVEDCLPFVGTDPSPENVCRMLKQVAGKNPDVLAQDGKSRISAISSLKETISAQTETAVKETTDEDERLMARERDVTTAYSENCESARRTCEEKIKALRDELEETIRELGRQKESSLEAISNERSENAKKREEAQNLSRAVNNLADSKIQEISRLLSYIKQK